MQKAGRQQKKKELTPQDLLKLEIARELGFDERISEGGWGSLTAAETGRIGGLMGKRMK